MARRPDLPVEHVSTADDDDAHLYILMHGDEQAFRKLTGTDRRELLEHCYRILGSVADAEDMLQDTLLAAWPGAEELPGPGLAVRGLPGGFLAETRRQTVGQTLHSRRRGTTAEVCRGKSQRATRFSFESGSRRRETRGGASLGEDTSHTFRTSGASMSRRSGRSISSSIST
jgi:hypothetical protein